MMRRAQPWLGTLVEIALAPDDTDTLAPGMIAAAFANAFAAVAHVHRRMSFHDAASDVSAINRLGLGQTCSVDPQTATVLRCALLLEDATDGLFNIACADRLRAWGQLPPGDEEAQPGSAASRPVPDILRNVLAIDAGCRVTRLRAGAIDLGGIAKGHAVDLAIEALRRSGVPGASVNAGGDLRTYGAAGLAVTIRDPAQPTRAGRTLMLHDTALATSADYFSRRRIDGVDTCALVDPRSGKAVLHGRSASVLAPTCLLADGLTKPVLCSADPLHPVLARFDASAFLL